MQSNEARLSPSRFTLSLTTINLGKVLRVEWTHRDGTVVSARVTFDTKEIAHFSGKEAQKLYAALKDTVEGNAGQLKRISLHYAADINNVSPG